MLLILEIQDYLGADLARGVSLGFSAASFFQSIDLLEVLMRTLISIATLLSISLPALALPIEVPEPETLSLVAVAALGLLLTRRRK